MVAGTGAPTARSRASAKPGWAPGRQLYFAMRSRPLAGHELHNTEQDIVYKGFPPPGEKDPAQRQIEGRQLVGTFAFGKLDAPLVVKVAISPVSEAGAIANLDAEVADFDFDRVRAQAKQEWTQALSVLDIDAPSMRGAVPIPRCTTPCWGRRCSWMPMASTAGRTMPCTRPRATRTIPRSRCGTPTVRCTVATLVQPEKRNSDFVNSMLAHHEHSPYGMLPVWSFHGLEDWCMIGTTPCR